MDRLRLLSLSFCLVWGSVWRTEAEPVGLRVSGVRGQISLNDMLKEVEQLMEDTQHKLEEAVHQELDIQTGDTPYNPPFKDARWNEVDHECLIDEDCEQDSYCLYNISSSKCLPCKSTSTECVMDEECCGEQLCVWGLCAQNKSRGHSGSICQAQSDCSPQHCCAFHKALLFPVCRPRPQLGQTCHDQPNQLLDLLMWDEEAPHQNCPCASGLQCQLIGQQSLCVEQKSSSERGV